MTYVTSVNELNKLLRTQIISQSQLSSSKVVNGLSVHGNTLDKMLSSQTFDSYDRSDVFIVFELRSRDVSSDMSLTEDNEHISYIRSYTLYVVVYGNDSPDVANKLSARFRTEYVKTLLQSQGIYLESISDPTSVNDFVNDTLWLRSDVSIDISCEFDILQTSTEQQFAEFSDINIIKEGE